MSRRRRRHADPATLPRHDPAERARERRDKEERDRAGRELVRANDALARVIAVMAAAVVYFSVWAANALFGVFPPPVGLDLGNPQFLVGAGALVGSLFLARYLVHTLPMRRLIALATWASAALGLVVLVFMVMFLTVAQGSEAFAFIVGGIGVTWFLATLWVGLLVRRARRLLPLLPEVG